VDSLPVYAIFVISRLCEMEITSPILSAHCGYRTSGRRNSYCMQPVVLVMYVQRVAWYQKTGRKLAHCESHASSCCSLRLALLALSGWCFICAGPVQHIQPTLHWPCIAVVDDNKCSNQ
jgi:hypothetical protein